MKYPQIFQHTELDRQYVFIQDEKDRVIGLTTVDGVESKRVFKSEQEIKRKRSTLVASKKWRLTSDVDVDTGLKLPITMTSPRKDGTMWTVERMVPSDPERVGVKTTILSMFHNSNFPEEKHTRYLKNMGEVKEQYDMLVKDGWHLVKQPEVNIRYADAESDEARDRRMKESMLMERLMEKVGR